MPTLACGNHWALGTAKLLSLELALKEHQYQ